VGGRKRAVRRHDPSGTASAEIVCAQPIEPQDGDRELVVGLVREGRVYRELSPAEALAEARDHHRRVRATMPAEAFALSRGDCAIETVHQ
jgi:nicotinate phosphoribosyltransferase